MEEKNSDVLTWAISFVFVIVFIIIMYFLKNEFHDEKQRLFKSSDNVFCPVSYKLIKGDGAFTNDRIVPLELTRVDIVSAEDGYLYLKSGNSFKMFDCVIKESFKK